jgi:hypothetical protein
MPYLDLTSTAQIRAVLTVSETDLPDEVIDGYGLEDDLGNFLDKQLPVWPQLLADNGANARRLRMAAKYYCAGTIARMAQIFVLKKDTDGSNEGQRSDKDGWAWVSASLLGQADGCITEIKDDLKLSPEVAMPFTVVSRGTPDRDPITTPRS